MADENLLDVGLRCAGDPANGVDIDRGVAPAKDGETFFANDAFENAFSFETFMRFDGEEHHTDAIFAGGRQGETELRGFAREKRVGDLNQQPSAIAGFRIASAGAAMREVDQNLNPFFNNVVGFLTANVG